MRDFTLCNLVFDDDGFFGDFPQIALRAAEGSAACVTKDNGLEIQGEVDFTTYLNSLSIGKWRKYATVGNACLHLCVKGAAFDLYSTRVYSDYPEIFRGPKPLVHVDAQEDWHDIDVVIPTADDAHIVSFAIECADNKSVFVRGGYWYTQVNESSVNDVVLAIATTTFRKETYVMRNMEAIRSELFANGAKSDQFHMFVIDNGRTLDAKAFSDGNITVLANPNVGGSGGFARGMMEALDYGATHVLLMDDDVRVFPESFIRTRNLLCLANERYREAFVEGAMLNMEDPNLLFEDVAIVKRDGMYGRIKEDLLVDGIEGMSDAESIDVEVERAYGAWWYCCIPTSVIRKNGLPLPLFVRCDDVEYGMRTKPLIMTMNGICVWHERFEGRFRASVDSYQLTRNFLIMSACDDLEPSIVRAFMIRFSRTFHIYLRSLNYDTCELMLDGLADYLKGPAFIRDVDGEQLLKKNGALNEVLEDVSEIDSEILSKAKPNPRYLGQGKDRGMILKTIEMIPHDRHFLPDFMLSKKPAPMYYSRGAYPARTTMRRSTLVAYDQSATKARVRTMDRKRWKHLRDRFAVLMHEYRKCGAQIAQEYRDAQPVLTSRDFWEQYLAARY